MYVPPQFREHDPDGLAALIERYPLASVVAILDGELVANHFPLQISADAYGNRVLRGHIARANDLWKKLPAGSRVLAIFTGPDAYITPSWYAAKETTGEVVPTWNYAVVHAHCSVRFEHDAARLRDSVGALVEEQEKRRSRPWRISDAPDRYVERMLSGIVGIELLVSRLEGKFKASQNHSPEDRRRVEKGLADDGVAAEYVRELVRDE
jgi:transcriptional regulator